MDGFLPWLGGKRRLAKRIVAEINRIPHTCYVEPFMGAAHVFFAREPVKTEVLNDLNRELVTLFRVLQHHLEEFLRYFKWALVSRDEFERLKRVEADTLTDIQRAARFYYLQKQAFGGKLTGQTFGTHTTGRPHLNLVRMEEELSSVHLRLAHVVIENLTWQNCIRRYDRPQTLFYIDPPYFGNEEDYGKGLFGREEFAELARMLAELKGRFLLSLNDTPEVRETFKAFPMQPVQTRYTVTQRPKNRGQVQELLIGGK